MPQDPTAPRAGEIEDLVPRQILLPGEDAAAYAGLHDAYVYELAPRTPYERRVVENLVRLEWEAYRLRYVIDTIILSKVKELAVGAFSTGQVQPIFFVAGSEKDKRNASALLDPDPQKAERAAIELRKLGISIQELIAEAHICVARNIADYEKRLGEIEIRRRRLRDDYDRLKAARARPIEEAEVIE